MGSSLRDQLQATLGPNYRLDRELGGGGMSRVFVAEDVTLGRQVVVKVLSPELAAGLSSERFRREIHVAAQLQHPHIVPVLAAGEVGDLPYYTMPYVAGQSLRARLDGGHGLPISETVAVLRDVAKALAYAHSHGVVHRDIKPDNVLISGGSAAVTDFGIAKAISMSRTGGGAPGTDTRLTVVGTSLGTPAYMAPEQAAGDPNADHRGDIYAFGAMAYELLTGHPPFHGRPPHQLFTAHMTEAPRPVAELRPEVPPSVAALVMRCLEKNPDDRPQTSTEVVAALESGTGSNPEWVATRPRTSATAVHDGAGSRRAVGIVAAALAVLIVLGFVARGMMNRPAAANDAVIAVMPFRVVSGESNLAYLREGMLDLLAVKLTGAGGLRATEPRTLLGAWRDAVGASDRDLTRDQAAAVARDVGASKLLLGQVIGTPLKLELSATVYGVEGDQELARVSVAGAPDSLAWLVDQLSVGLLAKLSPESRDQREGNLAGTSLPALRAYLDGQAKLRRANGTAAARDFASAIAADSSFALAGLGLHIASAWFGDQHDREAGLRVAWAAREKLGQRDRALLAALAGPRYPERSSSVEMYEAARQYLAIAPDRADAWMIVGDDLFHYGGVVGVPNHEEEALRHFKRASEIDSTYAVFYSHAVPLALRLGDSAFAETVQRRRAAYDTTAFWERDHRWFEASLHGDSATIRAMRDSLPLYPPNTLGLIVRHAYGGLSNGADAKRAMDAMFRIAPNAETRRQLHQMAYELSLTMGRPAEALDHLRQFNDPNPQNRPVLIVRNAMLGLVDSADAVRALAELAKYDAAGPATDSTGMERERARLRAVEAWRLSRRDTSRTQAAIDRLRVIARAQRTEGTADPETEIAILEAMRAEIRGTGLEPAVERLDSLLSNSDYANQHEGRLALGNFIVARLLERLGKPQRALAAVRRHAAWMNNTISYHATRLREEGRLAELAGDREAAIRAYRNYLSLRPDPEPSVKPEVEQVRRELERLEAIGR